MWTEFQTSRELGTLLLLTVALSSTAIWLATGATSFLLRRGSAACRHRLWGLSMLGVMIAPIVILELPLPRWTISNRDFVAEWIPRALDPSFDPHPKHSAGRDPLSARSEEPIEECGIQPGCATTPVHSVIDVSGKSVLHVLTWVWYSGMLVSGFLFVRSIRISLRTIRETLSETARHATGWNRDVAGNGGAVRGRVLATGGAVASRIRTVEQRAAEGGAKSRIDACEAIRRRVAVDRSALSRSRLVSSARLARVQTTANRR